MLHRARQTAARAANGAGTAAPRLRVPRPRAKLGRGRGGRRRPGGRSGEEAPMPAKLPVLGLVGEALRDVFGNLAGLVRIAWPYYALAAALVLAGAVLASEDPDGTPTLTGAV